MFRPARERSSLSEGRSVQASPCWTSLRNCPFEFSRGWRPPQLAGPTILPNPETFATRPGQVGAEWQLPRLRGDGRVHQGRSRCLKKVVKKYCYSNPLSEHKMTLIQRYVALIEISSLVIR